MTLNLYEKYVSFIEEMRAVSNNESLSYKSFEKNTKLSKKYQNILNNIASWTKSKELQKIARSHKKNNLPKWMEIEVSKALYDNPNTPLQ